MSFSRFINKLLGKKGKHTYRDKYNTLDQARAASNNSQDYGTKKYDKRSLNKLSFHEKYTGGRNMIIPIILSTSEQRQWTILDIGGGVNPIFSHLNHDQKLNTTCFTLEREEISNQLNSKIPDEYRNHLFYASSVHQVDAPQIDIAYFGSSIQYIEEHQALLSEIIEKNPQFIIFSESIFTNEDQDYYVIQTNMGSHTFPNRFTSLPNLERFLKKMKYEIVLNMATTGTHDHEWIDRSTYECRTLIYRAISATS